VSNRNNALFEGPLPGM